MAKTYLKTVLSKIVLTKLRSDRFVRFL
jgi:hypothetical protein